MPTVVKKKFTKATPCSLSKKDISDLAEKVAKQLGYKPGQSIEEIVKLLGGEIKYEELENILEREQTGSIEVRGKEDFTIYLSKYSSAQRDRFTVAHELGHYVLHALGGKRPIIQGRVGSSRVEWEANWFAAAFLMPAAEFKKIQKTTPDMSEVARHFRVSEQAARVRKNTLG